MLDFVQYFLMAVGAYTLYKGWKSLKSVVLPNTIKVVPPPSTTSPEEKEKIQVIVIGASTAGLSVGAHLKNSGVNALLLEKQFSSGAQWRNRYSRLHLHTPKQTSHLPFVPYPENFETAVPRNDLANYLDAYPVMMGLQVKYGHAVTSVKYNNDKKEWVVKGEILEQTGHARSSHHDLRAPPPPPTERIVAAFEYSARFLIIATGQYNTPNIPEYEGVSSFQGQIIHSSTYQDGERYRNKKVLLVGYGNTGMELSIDLYEHGAQPSVLIRSPMNLVERGMSFPYTYLFFGLLGIGRSLPVWAHSLTLPLDRHMNKKRLSKLGIEVSLVRPMDDLLLRHRAPLINIGGIELLEQGLVTLYRHEVKKFSSDSVEFTDGTTAPFDVVIYATGFVQHPLSFLPSEVKEKIVRNSCGMIDGVIEEPNCPPGLFVAGFCDYFGAIQEMNITGKKIADNIAAQLSLKK